MLLTPGQCELIADFLQGFSNPLRVRIMCVLHAGEQSVGEVASALGEKQSNVSQQLRVLLAKGFVKRRREGQHIYYAVKHPAICRLMEGVRDLLITTGGRESEVLREGEALWPS